MLYIVNCEVIKTYYMDDSPMTSVVTHIVEADSAQDAQDKVELFYKEKDIEFDVTHWVTFNYCNGLIS